MVQLRLDILVLQEVMLEVRLKAVTDPFTGVVRLIEHVELGELAHAMVLEDLAPRGAQHHARIAHDMVQLRLDILVLQIDASWRSG
jgi:hypothetical protein